MAKPANATSTKSFFTPKKIVLGLMLSTALGYGVISIANAESKSDVAVQAPAVPAAMPVQVTTLAEQNVRVWSEFSGRLEAVDFVQIRPRVSGTIEKILFKEGQVVKAGDPLFVIDTRSYEAEVANAEAALASAQTQAALATTELERARPLVATQAIAQTTFDQRANNQRVTKAAVDAAQATLRQAKLNLDFAYIKSPISGHISRAEITAGNMVDAGPNAPVLTTIVSNGAIYADFEIDEQTYLASMRQGNTNSEDAHIPVELKLAGDKDKVYKGFIKSFDNRLNASSGTIRARAQFENEDGALVPGMFATVRAGSPSENKVLLINDHAVGTDQDKKFVYTVDTENKVAYREVKLGATVDGQRVVLSGLQAGDRIVVNGLQMVRPDMVVAPKEASLAAPADAPKFAAK